MHRVCTVVVVVALLASSANADEPAAQPAPTRADQAAVQAAPASADEAAAQRAMARAEQIAAIFGLQTLVVRFQQPMPTSVEGRLERMELRADAMAALEDVSLLVDATLAKLQEEQLTSANARDFVRDRYQGSVLAWNIGALLIGGVTNIVGSSMQFTTQTQARIGDGIILGGAVVATTFAVVALLKRNRGRPPYAIQTNLLAQLLGRTPVPGSELPDPIWRYLDTPLVGEPSSLRSQLLDKWAKQGSISLFPSTPAARIKVDQLTRPISVRDVVSADTFDDRADMLADVRAALGRLHADIQGLIRLARSRH